MAWVRVLAGCALVVGCGGGGASGPVGSEGDADNDGLSDAEETSLGTNPAVPDTDGDGKKDGDEVHKFKTDPTKVDTDGDGAGDGLEIRNGTNPLVVDVAPPAPGPDAIHADDDGISDAGPQNPVVGAAPQPMWQCGGGVDRHWLIATGCFLQKAGGTFTMGAQRVDKAAAAFDPLAQPDEAPVRQVTVAPFWIQASEATAGLYARCVRAGVCTADDVIASGPLSTLADPERQKYPITGVTWAGASKLCGWLGGRLPTEAEWEFAARGTDGRVYPWGSAPTCGFSTERVGREGPGSLDNCAATGPRPTEDHPLAGIGGVRHLSGNVWEWTQDLYGPYDPASTVDPRGAKAGTHRTQRGGGWLSSSSDDFRAAGRASVPPDVKLPDVGFRCVWTGRPE